MDFERTAEFTTKEMPRKDAGFSEEEQAKILEGMTVDKKQVASTGLAGLPQASSRQTGNKRKPLPSAFSKKEKIIAIYRKNLEKIFRLVEAISQLEGKNYRQEEQIVEDIKKLRHIQEELLNALILEQKGMLTEGSLSKDAWDLIQ